MKNCIKKVLALTITTIIILSFNVYADNGIFADVPQTHWAYQYINNLVNQGVLSGYEDGSFKPENTVIRAEWAKMLYSIDGSEPITYADMKVFNDVEPTAWYAVYISMSESYLNKTENENGCYIYPQEPATREDVAVSAVKWLGYDTNKSNLSYLNRFTDKDLISENNKPYIAVAIELGIITGFEDNTFRGNGTLTRAQAATILYKAWKISITNNYVGDIVDEIPSGKGVYLCGNGDKYEGAFSNGTYNGYGIYTYLNGNRYEGNWTNGVPNGNGTLYYVDGSKYEGDWENGNFRGNVIEYYDNGARYEGKWENGSRNGYGVYYYSNGERYEGNWVSSLPNGQGIMYYVSGNRYEGNWDNGSKIGYGVYYWSNGDRYEGNWENDSKNGYGVYYWPNGDRYEGNWKDDHFNGYGIEYYNNGDRYEGYHDDTGYRSGHGVYYYADGTKEEGEWKNDERIK